MFAQISGTPATDMNVNCRAILTPMCVAALLFITGCEQPMPQGPYEMRDAVGRRVFPQMIATNAPTYAAGDRISFHLTNRSARPAGYNLCHATLERVTDNGDWENSGYQLGDLCVNERRILGPGQGVTFNFRVEPRARGGRYRIRTTLEELDGRPGFDVVSNTFALTREGSD
jgi:hypothetical protein